MSSSDRPEKPDRVSPASAERRGVLLGFAAVGSGLFVANKAGGSDKSAELPSALAQSAVKPLVVPFHGTHQAGITTPQPFSCVVAWFDVLVDKRDQLAGLFRDLTGLLRQMTEGGPLPKDDPRFPPFDNGLLGVDNINPERLTTTVAVGASLFDERLDSRRCARASSRR